MSTVKILFLTPYPTGVAGSQRFRFEQYYDTLTKLGISYRVIPFIAPSTWNILYRDGYTIQKIFSTLNGIVKRFFLLFQLANYDYIFIHRGSTILGPPFFEWIVSRLLKKKIIYDFDDAIWKLDISKANRIASLLKQPGKVPKLIKWSYRISAGNEYLAAFANKLNKDVHVVPTVVNTVDYHNRIQDQSRSPVHIGWTGTHTTLRYLDPLIPVIKKLEKQYDFKFYVICNTAPEWSLDSLEFIQWSKEMEIDDLMKFHIGIMPLPDDEWAKGKCGFKAIQYMALGIATVASAVGINEEIIDDGVNGMLIRDEKEWGNALARLLDDKKLREELGKNARETIQSKYSVRANEAAFLSLFKA